MKAKQGPPLLSDGLFIVASLRGVVGHLACSVVKFFQLRYLRAFLDGGCRRSWWWRWLNDRLRALKTSLGLKDVEHVV